VSRNGADLKQAMSCHLGRVGGLRVRTPHSSRSTRRDPGVRGVQSEKAAICRRMGAELIIDRRRGRYRFWADEHNQDPKEWKRLGRGSAN